MDGASRASEDEDGPRTLLPVPDPPTDLPPADAPTELPPADAATELPVSEPATDRRHLADSLTDLPVQPGAERPPAPPSPTADPHLGEPAHRGARAAPGGPGRSRGARRPGLVRHTPWSRRVQPDRADGRRRRRNPVAGLADRPVGGRVSRGLGEVMITVGLVVVLFLAYQLWITDIFAARTQDRLRSDLTTAWSRQPHPPAPGEETKPRPVVPPVELGEGVAVLRIPRFGADYAPVIVEGVSAAALRRGPGHFPGTAMPGDVGNFVVSGHRTTYGKPFSRLDELRAGDPLVVEVADRYFTYRVTGSEVVDPHRLDVTYPVPEHAGVAPTSALMTLTTCHPRFSARSRLIVFTQLDETTDKSDGPPRALADK